ncbi:MAG: thioredoxin family protein [Bacteroidia bacterium]|nr:thioredoxin family protein [Bacteroidia bacterium]
MNTSSYLQQALNYSEYKQLIQTLFAQGKTTGHNQSAELIDYAKLNIQRMMRVEKTTQIGDSLKATLNKIKGNYIWLVITEGWCGDAAQNLPAFELIEKVCPKIELKLILRDDNPELIDRYLTNGSRSIPKLICFEKETLTELFVWGPRPQALQNKVVELVKENMPKEERGLFIQKWYNADKSASLQHEMHDLIEKFMF